MECPRCKSNQSCKDGFAKGRQRYQCRSCKFRYTVEHRSTAKSLETKRLAISMYTEGLGFRAIGRILNISYMTVYRWVKAIGKVQHLASPTSSEPPTKMIEMDEIHTYVQSKKTTVGSGLQLIDMQKSSFPLFVGTEAQKLA